jgi:hypothetical protein
MKLLGIGGASVNGNLDLVSRDIWEGRLESFDESGLVGIDLAYAN